MVNITEKDKLMTVEEIANFLQLSPKTILEYVKAGDLRAIRVSNKSYRIVYEDFEKFIHERFTVAN